MNQVIDSSAFENLFSRARNGDESAWQELYDSCQPKVLRTVRRKLNSPAMRTLYDSTDFVGEVWTSLAANHKDFDFPTLESFLKFLQKSAERKVIDEYRRLHTLKHDINRDRHAQAMLRPDGTAPEFPSSDPTPSQYAQASEFHEQLLSRQNETERSILELKNEGFSNEEIAAQVEWNVRKVQRFLKDLGDSLSEREKGSAS